MEGFSEYYTESIHSVIDKLRSWNLRRFALATITANQSEALNSVLKRLQDWKEAPIDSMALSLFSLVKVYCGRKGIMNCALN